MRKAECLIAGFMLAAAAPMASAPAAAENVVQVEMQDASVDGSLQGMHMKLDRDAIKAGRVTFQVANQSQALVHELHVLRTNLAGSQLPYDSKKDVFVESKVKNLGEVSDMEPGKSGKLSLNLKAGSYVLACNKPGHLHAGMWTKFTVTP